MSFLEFDTIVEVPKNSKVKYEFCENSNKIRVDRILPSAYNYPFNYGYIENTIADDDDTLDVVILNDQSIYPMSVIKVKPVGVLLMRDGKTMETLESDPKILAYPVESVDRRYKDINDINDIQELDKMILKDFFSNYKNNENKVAVVDGFANKEQALKIIQAAADRFSSKKIQEKPKTPVQKRKIIKMKK